MPTTYDRATPCGSDTKRPSAVRPRPATPAPRKRVARAEMGRGAADALMLLQPSALFEGDVVNRGMVGALQGAHVGNHRPAILGAELVGVREHRVLAVGDRVEDFALGHAAEAVVVVGGAVNLETVLAAANEGLVHDDVLREALEEGAVRILAGVMGVVGLQEGGVRLFGAAAIGHGAGRKRAVSAAV